MPVSKQTPERIERLCELIGEGHSLARCADAVGITYATLRNWLRQGGKSDPGTEAHRLFLAHQTSEEVLLSQVVEGDVEIKYDYDKNGNTVPVSKTVKRSAAIALKLLQIRFPEKYKAAPVELNITGDSVVDEEMTDAIKESLKNRKDESDSS